MKKVYLIGIGTGTHEGLTGKASGIISSCDLLFGADRMLEAAAQYPGKKINTYKPDEISDFLKDSEWEKAGVLLSGDVGFYSGAKKLMTALEEYQPELVPGISTVSAFCAALGLSWDEVSVVSLHGRQMNAVGIADCSRYTFCLLDGAGGVRKLADRLLYYAFDNVILHIGGRIGYSDEKIYHMRLKEAAAFDCAGPVAAVIENPTPRERVFPELADEELIRSDVPMTKAEVRCVAIQKLGLSKSSVLYDIGAGTGSVAVQAALCYPESSVYAIECKEEALRLIEENKRKFRADNVTIVAGKAPEAFLDIPAPTHAFIGGSGGRMREILRRLWEKNPRTVVLISMITLETLSETLTLAEEYGIEPEVVQLSVSKAKKAGKSRLMLAQNPVMLIKLETEAAHE
ncbi:MAG: precorrin-6y C5,15-methyltransferase (decarboxylating) subunit CbiE [Lachnospiraceae bacterium]|nr:precorrin-6y C5,15-methyltransferase (decarboxylating) subunit CbiE [Lachnospiraceae bacterium]